jgi:hypothetical protein
MLVRIFYFGNDPKWCEIARKWAEAEDKCKVNKFLESRDPKLII